jgi:hypothetical protein
MLCLACRTALLTLLKYFNIPPWFKCIPSLDRNDRSAQKPRYLQNIMLLLLSDEINCFIATFICVTHRHLFLSMGAPSSLFLARKREEGPPLIETSACGKTLQL